LPNIDQARAVRMGGMKKGSETRTSSTRLPGVSVRAMTQAKKTHTATANGVFTTAMKKLLKNTL